MPHSKSSSCSCFVCPVLARVPAGARRAPAELGSRPVSARSPGARRATPSPTASTAAARTPALPSHSRRQEAAEPVPLHGGSRHLIPAPCYSVWLGPLSSARPDLTSLTHGRSATIRRAIPFRSAPRDLSRMKRGVERSEQRPGSRSGRCCGESPEFLGSLRTRDRPIKERHPGGLNCRGPTHGLWHGTENLNTRGSSHQSPPPHSEQVSQKS